MSKLMFLLSCFAAIPLLTGCVTEGAAFGIGAGSLHETVMTEKVKNVPSPVYGPPQIIYHIDENRFFTLEDYTRCENGKTFYNNKKNNIHVQVSPSSGYLFKGRFFWFSERDDFLAFPLNLNDNKAACLGSDKGCLNVVSVSADGGKETRSVTYGPYTQDPNEDTKNYDMLVMGNKFYLIYYRASDRSYPVIDGWELDDKKKLRIIEDKQVYDFFKPGEAIPIGGFYKIELLRFERDKKSLKMQCNRSLEPK